ncbi:unnamed protein product [Caenorhabditis bovis]|uniref:Receptor protein-tyrosine kinase n=1 Tax=Caenorhabditis bovis TaxID=2654633 RepID=A0A8S1EH84_9PELO|nr:unnamed protein product [Caenorhabditis bovis]
MSISPIFIIFFLFRVETKFNSRDYYRNRVWVSKNGTELFIMSETEGEARQKYAFISPACPNSTVANVLLASPDYCSSRNCRNFKALPSFYSISTDTCHCKIKNCSAHNSDDYTILYPGCKCDNFASCWFNDTCDQWTIVMNETPFTVFHTGKSTIPYFLQAGSNQAYLNHTSAIVKSKFFRQSGIECEIQFLYHLVPQSKESHVRVRAILESGDSIELWKSSSGEKSNHWERATVDIGSFGQPFQLSIECNSGAPPTSTVAHNLNDQQFFICSLGEFKFVSCDDIGNPEMECSRPDVKICNGKNVKCLKDVECDMKKDCYDGSDEQNCSNLPKGSQCNYNVNSTNQLCDGWSLETRSKYGTGNLFKIGIPDGINIPVLREDSKSMLIYDGSEVKQLKSMKTVALVSPVFPPTNIDAYRKRTNKTCKIRVMVCSHTYYDSWTIAVIGKEGDVFENGKRKLITFGHIRAKTRIGSSGRFPPSNCDRDRDIDGETGIFMEDGGTGAQLWNIAEKGFYRLELCGAGGGSSQIIRGEPGKCALFQMHLQKRHVMRIVIGQMGESPCVRKGQNNLNASCSTRELSNKNVFSRRVGGAGGGGSSMITFERGKWDIIVGGGAGAPGGNWTILSEFDAGIGFSVARGIKKSTQSQCKILCRSSSAKTFQADGTWNNCMNKAVRVYGGFGGGGSSCGVLGGGGAGAPGGAPGENGESYVNPLLASEALFYPANTVQDGSLKILKCSKICPESSVCRFRGDRLQEEYCACPGDIEFKDGSSCECPLNCPWPSTCVLTNFTYQPVCQCPTYKTLANPLIDRCQELTHSRFIVFVLLFFAMLVVTVAYISIRYCKRKTVVLSKELIEISKLKTNEYLYDDIYFGNQTRKSAIDNLPTIDRNSLKTGVTLGKGNFGEVLYGHYNASDGHSYEVAVKTISKPFSASISAQADFCNEALCMSTFAHSNIVHLIGVSFDDVPYLIVTEFMEGGDLLTFVREARPSQYSLNPYQLTMSDLIHLVRDVAAGCSCLEQFGYVHRDIAARNILLTRKKAGRVAKIADFGMAKEINMGSVYYRLHGRAMLPIKWTPPEAFIDGMFTTKSDVWSFGILGWEVFSLGVIPYPNRRNEEVMIMITEGERLEYPFGIPPRIYKLMRNCWKTNPNHRPTFDELLEQLDDILLDNSVTGMPFPTHPAVRASFARAQSTPQSCETPQTSMTEISAASIFAEAMQSLDMADMIKLHEIMMVQEEPYVSEISASVMTTLRQDLARQQMENGAPFRPSLVHPKQHFPQKAEEKPVDLEGLVV